MMRAERLVTDERIWEEVETYNEPVPGPNQLSATLFIEITDQARLRQALDQFVGVDPGGTTFLVIGNERVEGVYEGDEARSHASARCTT